MRGRSLVYAFSGIIGEHISFGITGGCPMCTGPRTGGCSRSFASLRMTKDAQDDNALSRILHSVYGDKVAASSMTTRGRLRSGRDGGPRTSQICILLKYRLLQNIVVRGPHFFEGTANRVILHCIVSQRITKNRCSRSAYRRASLRTVACAISFIDAMSEVPLLTRVSVIRWRELL